MVEMVPRLDYNSVAPTEGEKGKRVFVSASKRPPQRLFNRKEIEVFLLFDTLFSFFGLALISSIEIGPGRRSGSHNIGSNVEYIFAEQSISRRNAGEDDKVVRPDHRGCDPRPEEVELFAQRLYDSEDMNEEEKRDASEDRAREKEDMILMMSGQRRLRLLWMM